MVDVEQLYKSFGVLADAKVKACEHLDSFQVILDDVKGNTAAKRLSAQFISRFFKNFPEEANRAIEALFDLCEDEDINVREMLKHRGKTFMSKNGKLVEGQGLGFDLAAEVEAEADLTSDAPRKYTLLFGHSDISFSSETYLHTTLVTLVDVFD